MSKTQAVESLVPGDGLRRPPRPPELSELERLARLAQGSAEGLKSERVEEMLRQLAGWQLTLRGRGITCSRELPSPTVAALYSAFVTGLAATVNLPVMVNVSGGRVLFTLHSPLNRGRIPLLTEAVFALARYVG
jgi:hypothetical protein